MKITKFLLPLIVVSLLFSQTDYEPLAEKIKKVSEDLLEGYTQPLNTTFGTGISTGLFHSAQSHKTLGFDIGVRAMYIQIPEFAKYFDAKVLTCSLANNQLYYDSLILDSVSTIFGPKTRTNVPVSGNAVGIPPYIPAGFGVSGVPFVVPQLNVGLMFGSELVVRYVPFTYRGSRVDFLGVGLKQNLNSLPFMKIVPLPVDIALGGAIQDFGIEDSTGYQIVNSHTWNLQLIVSKNLIAFEPMVGFGFEGTKVYFKYDFEYEIPDTLNPGNYITVTDEVDIELVAQNSYRAIIGFTFKLGILYLHYDYNLVPHYKTHNGIIGFSLR